MDELVTKTPWLTRRLQILLGIFAVTLLGALSLVFLFDTSPVEIVTQPSTQPTEIPSSPSTPPTPVETFSVAGPSFLVVEGLNDYKSWKAILYNIASGGIQQMDHTAQYPLEAGKLAAGGTGSVQWSNNGKVFAYSVSDPPTLGYEGTPNSYQLIVLQNGKTEIALKDLEHFQIDRWLLAPDGSAIVYVRVNADDEAVLGSASKTLYKYDVNSKEHTKIVADFTKFDSGEPFFANTTTVVFPRPDEDKLYLYTYDLANNKAEDKLLFERTTSGQHYTFSLDGITISPDQKLVAMRFLEDGIWKVKLLHSDTGDVSDLITVAADRSVNNLAWSPDSKLLAFETTVYAAGSPEGHTTEVWSIEVSTKKKTVVDTHTWGSEGYGGFTTFGWSPDGKYLAYLQATKLFFYNLEKNEKQLITTFSEQEHPSGIINFGWVGY